MSVPSDGVGFKTIKCSICLTEEIVVPDPIRQVSAAEELTYNVSKSAFQCLHREFCKGCVDSHIAAALFKENDYGENVVAEIYVEGNNEKVLVKNEAKCPTCQAFQVGSQLEYTNVGTIKLKGTTGLLNGDPNLADDPRRHSRSGKAPPGVNTPPNGAPAAKKLSKKTVAKVALACLTVLAVLAAILVAVMCVI